MKGQKRKKPKPGFRPRTNPNRPSSEAEGTHEDFQEFGDDNDMECDFSAYKLFHEGSAGPPCLTFDIVKDTLGDKRTVESPVSLCFVVGTQTNSTLNNSVILMKMKNLHRVKLVENEEDSGSELEDDEDEENRGLPIVSSSHMKHEGCVNRIRATQMNGKPICASWSELGKVHIWDMRDVVDALDDERSMETENDCEGKPLFTFEGHRTEGFGLDWNPVVPGTLATGDCEKLIYVWNPTEDGTWQVSDKPFEAHTASVEDIQWSPNEAHVFASCSVDKSIRIWDDRSAPQGACKINVADAHLSDVNVISWNRSSPFLASGGDDGVVKIWDLRQIQDGKAVANLNYHKKPITTVEWEFFEPSVLASGGEDDLILQWDPSLERDTENGASQEEDLNIPQELLFEHQGQKNIKELHWHPQIPGVIISTAESGFHIFKTISV